MFLGLRGERWPGRMPRLPLTKREVRDRVYRRYNADEAKTIGWKAEQVSEACRISTQLQLPGRWRY